MPKKRKVVWNRLTGKPIGSEKRNPFTEKRSHRKIRRRK
jgi:hypothetical protein